ncbi:bone morphogenetic protein 2-like [Sycon ciliatum]|uniref:bone morphogenetic protein 2-like n=1 Tax=Sycon ciliatum TaxID=27933 RepID=UPI0031F6C107
MRHSLRTEFSAQALLAPLLALALAVSWTRGATVLTTHAPAVSTSDAHETAKKIARVIMGEEDLSGPKPNGTTDTGFRDPARESMSTRQEQRRKDTILQLMEQSEENLRKSRDVEQFDINKNLTEQYDIIRAIPMRHTRKKGHNNCGIITFDLHQASHKEKLVRAELLLNTKLRVGAARSSGSGVRIVRIYRVGEDGSHRELITQKVIAFSPMIRNQDKIRWETFDVLPAVKQWMNGEPNHGLQLDVLANNESMKCGSRPDVHFVRGFHKLNRPVLLVYSHDYSEPIRRHGNQRVLAPYRRSRRSSSPAQEQSQSANLHRCMRREYNLDFLSAGILGDSLIAPATLDIGICNGECISPGSTNGMRLTNHARLQAVLHSNKTLEHTIPAPCCSPNTLGAVSFIYQVQGTMVARIRHDVVVDSCGCR